MSFIIAVAPDDFSKENATFEKRDSFAVHWLEVFKQEGHKIKYVNVRSEKILEDIRNCHAFLWRWKHTGGDAVIAKNLLPVVENVFKLPVFPNQQTCWHYDNKAAQAYLLQALNIPHPRTWLFHDATQALHWATGKAEYPLVLKLSTGAGSINVIMLNNKQEAVFWINRMFAEGTFNLSPINSSQQEIQENIQRYAQSVVNTGFPPGPDSYFYDYHKGYILFQHFLPNNEFDTRVTVIGNRAFCFRRQNRPQDFRASGSGVILYEQEAIDPSFIHLAFSAAKKINSQSLAIDGLYDDGEPIISEISYTYAAWAVHNCTGHWVLHGEPFEGELEFVAGHMWPGTAQAIDFLKILHSFWS